MDTFAVVVCGECQTYWRADNEAPRCLRSDHSHRQLNLHRHHDVVVLPDGTPVVATSFDADDPYRRDQVPDYGLYFDPQWQPPWPHGHPDWPDFGVPTSSVGLIAAFRALLSQASMGQRVEVGCIGGRGRTGTALACLAIMSGLPSDQAVEWVRTAYCAEAVETAQQQAFVARFREYD